MSSRRLASASASLLAVVAMATFSFPAPAGAATAIDLGTATSFAVLAGSAITNTGATTITGDVGSFPTDTMTGFETVTLAGANHGGNAVTQSAKNALDAAYDQAFASAPATSVATELGGRTLKPGTYHGDTLGITGALTLDTLGDPNAVFVFQAAETLKTASASSVIVLGGSIACNVFWQVGSSATFGENSTFVGNVLAHTSITANDGATFEGRLLARGGAVTMQHNTISARTCAAAPVDAGSVGTDATPASTGETSTAAPTPIAATPAAPATTTPAAATPPRRTTRATPAGGSTTGVGRPGLATTGIADGLGLIGAVTAAFGLLLVRVATPPVPLRHAVPRRRRDRRSDR